MSKSAPTFDVTKLEWMNGEYIRGLKISDLELRILKFIGDKYDKDIVKQSMPLVQQRIKKLSEYVPMCEFLFKRPENYEKEVDKELVGIIIEELSRIDNWKHDQMYEQLEELAAKKELSKSKLFMQVRLGVAGRKVGPPLFESLEILGKKEVLARLMSSLA